METPDKALPHVVTGLIAKRSEIAGQIEHLQAELKAKVCELDCIEGAIRVFDPEIDIAAIAPRKVPPAHHAFRGEVSRIVLEALRKADRPLSTADLTERVMRERGLDLADKALRRTMSQRVGACLRHWRKRAALQSLRGAGHLQNWQII